MINKTGVLIVDDSDVAVEGIIDGVDWAALGAEPFPAYSSSSAQKILSKQAVDIIVCDIEMPGGSGLQLIEWVREQYPEIECIFLTSYDLFEYAQKAITLRSFDYILKPARYSEIESVLVKAKEKIAETRQNKRMVDYASKWIDQKIASAENVSGSKKNPDKIVDDVKSFIMQHLSEEITMDALARLFFVTPDHLTRIFKKHTGYSIVEYIGRERIELAARMLIESTLSANIVAEAAGYRSYNHFVKMFRKAYHMSPTQYRQQHQKHLHE